MRKKWAQLSRLGRAYEKVKSCNEYLFRDVKIKDLTIRQARERNRYYQLLGHWYKLKKEIESNTTANS